MNKVPHPTREIAHFVASILAARQTPNEEIPYLISSVRDTIEALRGGVAQAAVPQAQQVMVQAMVAEPRETQRRSRRPKEPWPTGCRTRLP